MNSYLITFHRDSFETGYAPDLGEKVGKWGLGWLSLGFGKSVKVTQIDQGSHWQLSFEKEEIPLWQRITAAVSAILLFPISLLLAGIGCIGFACSDSHTAISDNYTMAKYARGAKQREQKLAQNSQKVSDQEVSDAVKVKSPAQTTVLKPSEVSFEGERVRNAYSGDRIGATTWLWTDYLMLYTDYLWGFHKDVLFEFADSPESLKYTLEEKVPNSEEWESTKAAACILNISKSHWTSVYICRETRTVEYYDSFINYGTKGCSYEEIIHVLGEVAETLSKRDPGEKPYQLCKKITQKIQKDAYNCGPLSLYFIEHRIKNPNIDFNTLDISQKEINRYRMHVKMKIIEREKTQDREMAEERQEILEKERRQAEIIL